MQSTLCITLALVVIFAVMAPAVLAQERQRTDTGVMAADRFSALYNDRIKTDRFAALNFGASVLDTSNLNVKKNARLDIPGSVMFEGKKTEVGGNGHAGGISIQTGVNDIVASADANSRYAGQDVDGLIEGSLIQIDAFDNVVVEAPQGDVRLRSSSVEIEGSDRGVAINARAGDITFTNVNETSSRFAVSAREATINSKTATEVVSNSSITVSAARNADVAGGVVAVSSQERISLDSAVGSIFIDSLTQVRLAGSKVDIDGDSGVHISSFGSSLNMASTEPTKNVNLVAGNAVQIEARRDGVNLTSTTGDIDISVANIEMDFAGSVNFAGAGGAEISADDTVIIHATTKTKITATTTINLVSNQDAATSAVRINAKAPAIKVNSRAGDIRVTAYTVDMKTAAASTITASTAVDFVGDISASLTGDTITVTTTATNADIVIDSGHALKGQAAGAILFKTVVGDVTLESPLDVKVAAGTGSTVTATTGVNIISNGNTFFNGKDVHWQSDADVIITNNLDTLFAGKTATIDSVATSSVIANDLLQFKAFTDKLSVTSTQDALFTALRSTITSDLTTFTSTETTTITGKTGVDLAAVRSITTTSAQNTLLNSNAGIAVLSSEGNIVYTTSDGGIDWFSDINRFSARRDLGINYGKIVFTDNTNIDFRAAGGILMDAKTELTVDPEGNVVFTAKEDITTDAGAVLSVLAQNSITGDGEAVEFHSTEKSVFASLFDGAGGAIFFTSSVIGKGDIDTIGYSTGTFLADQAVPEALLFDADETVSWNGEDGLTFTTADKTTIKSGKGQDIRFDSGNDITVAAGGNLLFQSKEFAATFDERADINGGTVLVKATNAAATKQNDVFIRASANLNVKTTTSSTIQGGASQIAGDELVRIVGGKIDVDSINTNPKSIVVEADGGGSRWSSNTEKDISFTASVAFRSTAVDTIKGITADGKIFIKSGQHISINQGTTQVVTGEGEELLVQSLGGVQVTTSNEEDITVEGDRELIFQSTLATDLESSWTNPLQSPTNTDFLDDTVRLDYFEPIDNAIMFETRDADVCINNVVGGGTKTASFKGGNGVSVLATGHGGDIELRASQHIKSSATGSLAISSDGWGYDPLGIVGLDYKVGVILRTTDPTKQFLLKATQAGIYMYGEDGITHDTVTDKYTISGTNVEVRVKDYLDKASFIAELGIVNLKSTVDTLIRAGTPTLDGSVRLNATNTASIQGALDISLTQHGSSTDDDRTGIRFYSEQGDLFAHATARGITIDADTNGAGRVDAIAQTGTMSFKNNGANPLSLIADDARLSIQGQLGLSIASQQQPLTISSKGPEGSFNIDSAGDQAITFQSLGDSTVRSVFQSSKNMFMEAFAGVFSNVEALEITSTGGNAHIAAGGSLSVISDTNEVKITAKSIVRSEAARESTFDAITHILVDKVAAQENIMRVGAGGNPTTSGTVINAVGRIELGENGPEILIDAEEINMLSGNIAAFMFHSIRGTTRDGQLRFEAQNGDVEVWAGKGDILVHSTEKMDITTLAGKIDLTAFRDNGKATVNFNSALKFFTQSAGLLTLNGEDQVRMFHGDFLVDVPQTVHFESTLQDIDVNSDARLLTTSVSKTEILVTTAVNGVVVKTIADDSDILLETEHGTASSILVEGNKGVLLNGLDGVSIHGENSILLKSVADVVEYTSANNFTTISNNNQVKFAPKLESDIIATSTLRARSDGTLTGVGGNTVVFTAVEDIHAQGDQAISFTSLDAFDAFIQSKLVVDISASNDFTFKVTGADLKIFPKTKFNLITTEDNPIGKGMDISVQTLEVASEMGTITYDSMNDVSISFNQAIDFKGDAVTITSEGLGGVEFFAAGTSLDIQTATPLQFIALNSIDINAANDMSFTPTTSVSLISQHEHGDIVFHSPADTLVQGAQLVKLHAFGKDTEQGFIRVESANAITLQSQANTLIRANREVRLSSTHPVSLNSGGGATPITARNSVLFESQATNAATALKIGTAALTFETLGAESAIVLNAAAGDVTFTTGGAVTTTAEFDTIVHASGVATIEAVGAVTFNDANSLSPKILVESERRNVIIDAKYTGIGVSTYNINSGSGINLFPNVATTITTNLVDMRGEEAILFENTASMTATAATMTISAANAIDVTAEGALTVSAATILTAKTNGPLADIIMNSELQLAVTAGTTLSLYSETNLGNIGASIRSKHYNHFAFDFTAVDAKVLVKAANNIDVISEQGAIELFGSTGIKYNSATLGFAGADPVGQQTVLARSAWCSGAVVLTCANHITAYNDLRTAWMNYGYSP